MVHADEASENHLLLITDDCCHPEVILPLEKTRSIFGLLGTAGNVSSQVQSFRNAAVTESCENLAQSRHIPFRTGSFKDLLQLIEEQQIAEIITVAPGVGPTREMLDLLQTRLKHLDASLLQQTRIYDELCWPHATAGFFKLKTKIPSILDALGVSEGGQQSMSF